MTDTRRIEYLPLDDIVGATRNPKKHNLDGVKASIGRFGYTSPVLRDERTGRLVAGHGRTQALRVMQEAGENPPEGVRVDPDGRWHVPVVVGWASRSDAEAEAYLVADNRWSEVGGWHNDELTALLENVGPELADIAGYTADDIANLLVTVTEVPPAALTDPDDVPDTPTQPISAPGDVWQLGPHRVLCGDSTDLGAVDALLDGAYADCVFTDPPYNADYSSRVDKARRKPWGGIANDNMSTEDFDAFLLDIHSTAWAKLKDGGAIYVWTDWKRYPQVARIFGDAFTHKSTIVWDKDHFGLGTYYRTQYELALFGVKGEQVGTWNSGHNERDVWTVARDSVGSYVHPTQKPVELALRALRNSANRGETVLDLFGGSGSTLMAAHQLGMPARMVELDSRYVDVICRRYQKHTGVVPERINPDGTTTPVDFLTDPEGGN